MDAGLAAGVLAGDERAVARGISLLEAGGAPGLALLAELRRRPGRSALIGITGAPGSGKSTLTDRLIGAGRAADERVAVLAVDPSSPFSGGAILGDRIRMMRWHDDPGVYIRSLASRGQLGGLSAAALQAAALLDAAGFDRVLLETVGVGQSEVDIAAVAGTTILVMTPGQGDGVQAFKAGIMEIADIFVVNKADHPGVSLLRREIAALLSLGNYGPGDWKPPIVSTVSTSGEGIDSLTGHIRDHAAHLNEHGGREKARARRERAEVGSLLSRELQAEIARAGRPLLAALLSRDVTPAGALRRLLAGDYSGEA